VSIKKKNGDVKVRAGDRIYVHMLKVAQYTDGISVWMSFEGRPFDKDKGNVAPKWHKMAQRGPSAKNNILFRLSSLQILLRQVLPFITAHSF